MQGQDNDDVVFIPETTFQTKIQGGLQKYVNGTILVSADSEEDTGRAQTQVTARMLVGVGFGLFPARKASRLDPIVALRYE